MGNRAMMAGVMRKLAGMPIRYVKWWMSDSIAGADAGYYFAELEVINTEDLNVALGKNVTSNWVPNEFFGGMPSLAKITDGNRQVHTGELNDGQFHYVKVDLGLEHNIKQIGIWSYLYGWYVYDRVKVEVSTDDLTYITVFDTDISGTYTETTEGKTIYL